MAIASLVAVPFAHATSGDSTPFLLDTRNYTDSTPLFSVDTRSPDLIANTGITDSGGNSFTITMEMLKVTGGGTITFTLVTGPVHGTLFLDGIAQDAGATFTQAQIDAGLVSYQRAAGDPLTDTFEVAAMDDNAGLLGGNLSFAVAGIPGASGTLFLVDTRNYTDSTPLFSVDTRSPDLIANTGITDSGGNSFTITMEMLKVTGGGTITFTLVTGPVHGTLFLDGIAQDAGATFTQAQIDAGLVSYQRAAGDPLTDTFEVAAMDDNAGLLGGNLSFAVAGIPGASGSLFLVDTRNYTDSGDSTVHTDKRAYLTADTVPGSLRQAIANAAAGETVDFDAGLSGGTITLGGSQLLIAKDLTVDASALPAGITISGNDSSRLFEVASGTSSALVDLTLTGGNGVGLSQSGGGGAVMNQGELTLSGCTLSGNAAVFGGGGAVFSFGSSSKLTMNQSTVSGNIASFGGGFLLRNSSLVTFEHCTISGNTGITGTGGIVLESSASLTLRNSLLAANELNGFPISSDIGGSGGVVTLDGSNIIGGQSPVYANAMPVGIPSATGNYVGTEANPVAPMLAPLGDYGGPTQTMALRAGSLAINAAGASALTTDQRGFTRVGAPDIGAYEAGNAAGFAVWAIERIAYGLNMTYTGDAEDDGSPNGGEYALGTSVMISDPDSVRTPTAIENASGHVEITFGFNPDAAVDTAWVLKRSTNMVDFDEIYRYDGPTSMETLTPGVSAVLAADTFTVTDTNAFSDRVFYQFVADQDMFMSY